LIAMHSETPNFWSKFVTLSKPSFLFCLFSPISSSFSNADQKGGAAASVAYKEISSFRRLLASNTDASASDLTMIKELRLSLEGFFACSDTVEKGDLLDDLRLELLTIASQNLIASNKRIFEQYLNLCRKVLRALEIDPKVQAHHLKSISQKRRKTGFFNAYKGVLIAAGCALAVLVAADDIKKGVQAIDLMVKGKLLADRNDESRDNKLKLDSLWKEKEKRDKSKAKEDSQC
jgi:hypothetical protein